MTVLAAVVTNNQNYIVRVIQKLNIAIHRIIKDKQIKRERVVMKINYKKKITTECYKNLRHIGKKIDNTMKVNHR